MWNLVNELLRRRAKRPQTYQTQTPRRVKVIRREDCEMTMRVLNGYLVRVDIRLNAPKPEFRKYDKWTATRRQMVNNEETYHSVISIQSDNHTKLYERLKT